MSPMSPRLLRPRAAGGFSPKNISGLVAWFDAEDVSTFTLSGSDVSEWRDKSGNGYAVAQSDSNNRPARTGTVGGRACIDFDGTNDRLSTDDTGLGTAMSGDKAATVFVVGEMQTSAENAINNQGTWISWGSSTSGTPFVYFRSNGTSGGGSGVNLRNDSSATTGQPSTGQQLPAGDGSSDGTAVDSFIFSGSIPTAASGDFVVSRVHTVMSATGDGIAGRPSNGSINTATASRAGTVTVNRFTVGALGRNNFGDFFPGRIAEVIIYSRVLSAAERSRIVQWLESRYKLSTPVL
jgi:hypothetical protein